MLEQIMKEHNLDTIPQALSFVFRKAEGSMKSQDEIVMERLSEIQNSIDNENIDDVLHYTKMLVETAANGYPDVIRKLADLATRPRKSEVKEEADNP